MDQFQSNSRRCNCNQTCEETHYEATVSSAVFPSQQYLVLAKLQFDTNITTLRKNRDILKFYYRGGGGTKFC